MLNKQDIIDHPEIQLRLIRHFHPQANDNGKPFKIREEKTPSARLKLYKGVWYLKDFGDGKKARDCFGVIMDQKSCNFSEALKSIEDMIPNLNIDNQIYGSDKKQDNHIQKQLSAIVRNDKYKATEYLNRRGIVVQNLPENAFYYDSYKNAIVFTDSEQTVLNRRMIKPDKGLPKANMSKYSGFDPIYNVLFKKVEKSVFLTEGVINTLSLADYSSISIFTTSNQIKDAGKLAQYIIDKEVIIAFDNDDAGNVCAEFYQNLIFRSNIEVKSLKRLLLPKGKDINDLLVNDALGEFLQDSENYEEIQNTNSPSLEQSTDEDNSDGNTFNQSKNQQIEAFLEENYSVRYNSIKQQPEICPKKTNSKYFPVTKYVLNSLRRELNFKGITTSADNIKSILESDYAPIVHPIQLFFQDLPEWDQKMDYISMLADTITVDNQDIWHEYFKKWLVAVVANVLSEVGCKNHTCLVITGKQGAFKTTWLDNLCPKQLSQYLFTGKIDPQNKDSLTYIAEYFLINIDDQLRQLNKRDENELKNLITTPSVKYRRPYDIYITEYPHTASFMASVNGNDFLTDPTGSRRFLPFEAIEINIDAAKAIDMDLVYSQALSLYRSGFQYWFTHKEIESLHKHNQAFQVVSNEEQLILEYFEKPDNREAATEYLQSAIIQTHLEKFTRSRLSSKKLGEALTKLGFEKWQRTENGKTKRVWSVIKKELTHIDDENNNTPF